MASFAGYMNKLPDVEATVYQYDPEQYESSVWEWESEGNVPQRHDVFLTVEAADIVVYQKLHNRYSYTMLQIMRDKFDKTFLLELDDYLLNLPIYNAAAKSYQPGSEIEWLAREQIADAHAIITATPWLMEACENINGRALLVPNTIDFAVWDKVKKPKPRKKIRIGWVGGASHTEDLRILEKPLEIIFEKYKNVDFCCVQCIPEFFKDHPRIVTKTDWFPILEYPQGVASLGFDIGVAPLLDNEFNRAKSNLRWLEYSALGIPTVASAVEPFNKSISPGKTGYLVSNDPSDWAKRLDTLITDHNKRVRMGEAAQTKVRRSYRTEKVAKDYLSILKGLV